MPSYFSNRFQLHQNFLKEKIVSSYSNFLHSEFVKG